MTNNQITPTVKVTTLKNARGEKLYDLGGTLVPADMLKAFGIKVPK